MKILNKTTLGLLIISSVVLADGGSHKGKYSSNETHMGDHMNKDGMPSKKLDNNNSNTHMGDHMHNGKMQNHMNKDSMPNKHM